VWMNHTFEEFELERSVWSAPIVMFLAPIGKAGSILMLLLLMLNTTIQVIGEPAHARFAHVHTRAPTSP
jgi:hypothetical protein